MSNRLNQLGLHRELLVMRAELQRATLVARVHSLRRRFAFADRGTALLRRIRAHPVLAVFTLAAAGYTLRRRLRRVIGFGWSAWRMYKFALARMQM